MDSPAILIIDENPGYLESLLPVYGYDVTCIKKAAEAVSYLMHNPLFDLVLLDISISRHSGWDILAMIRNNPFISDLPVIVYTSIDDPQKMIMTLNNGADDYIVKPCLFEHLMAKIDAVLRRSGDEPVSRRSNSSALNSLSKEEREILTMLTQGKDNKAIAEKFGVSPDVIKNNLASIYEKLNNSARGLSKTTVNK